MKPLLESSEQTKYNKTTSVWLSGCSSMENTGYSLLMGVSQGILHLAFGVPAGVRDILIGVTAIPFAYFLRKGFSWSKYALVVWSILGIADLANAVSLGLITASEFGTSTMTTFPWILVPTGGTSRTDPAWNYPLPSEEHRISS